MLFKNSVRTSKRTPHFTSTEINWLTLFKEIIFNYPFEDEACLNVIYEFSPYLKENTTLHHYKDQLVNAV
jgi:hypothetical protein